MTRLSLLDPCRGVPVRLGECLCSVLSIMCAFASRECSRPRARSCSTASRTQPPGWSWRLACQACSPWSCCSPPSCRSRRRCSSTGPLLSGESWPLPNWSGSQANTVLMEITYRNYSPVIEFLKEKKNCVGL